MSTPPPIIPSSQRPQAANRYQQMARASWFAPLIAFGVGFLLMAAHPEEPGKPDLVRGILGVVFIFGGLILGVLALFGIRRHGRTRILVPALIGICINLFLIGMAALPVLYLARNHVRLQPVVHSQSAYSLQNDRLHFSIDIPEGFRDYPEGKRASNIEHVLVKGTVGGGEALTVINIERMNGLIPKNRPLKRDHIPAGINGELTNRNWRGLNVDAFVASVEQGGVKLVVYTVQVPLKPSAIQLNVGGPESKRGELSQLTDTLLASLDGETSW